jgi:multidrug resistance efflux pump
MSISRLLVLLICVSVCGLPAEPVTGQDANRLPSVGSAIARGEALIVSAGVAGTIAMVSSELDDLLAADELILRFEAREADLAYQQSDVDVQRALTAVERCKALVSQAKSTAEHRREDLRRNEQLGNSVSDAELRRSREAVENAEAAHVVAYQDYLQAKQLVAAAELRREQATLACDRQHVRAPIAGQVVRLHAVAGERVELGTPLVELRRMDVMFCDFELPEDSVDVRDWQARTVIASFTIAGENKAVRGTIQSVASEIDARGRVAVRVRLINELVDGRWLLSHGKQVTLSVSEP